MVDGGTRLSVDPVPGGWAVSFGLEAATSVPPAAGGSDGSGREGSGSGSPDSSGSSGSSGSAAPPGGTVDPNVPTTSSTPSPSVTVPPAVNLPEPTEAERIARSLLDRMGIAGTWSATDLLGADDIACVPVRRVPLVPTMLAVELAHCSTASRSTDSCGKSRSATTAGSSGAGHLDDGAHDRPVPVALGRCRVCRPRIRNRPEPVPRSDHCDRCRYRDSRARTELRAPEPAAPITVTIDHVALGFTVFPASDNGIAVVDVVPTYVFTGTMGVGAPYTQALVAVDASIVPPAVTAPPYSKPIAVSPPSEPQPLPQPEPVTEPTVSGKPPT